MPKSEERGTPAFISDLKPGSSLPRDVVEELAAKAPETVLFLKTRLTRERHLVSAQEAVQIIATGDVSDIWIPRAKITGEVLLANLNTDMLQGGRRFLSPIEIELVSRYVQESGLPHPHLGKIEKIWTGDHEAILAYVQLPGWLRPQYLVRNIKTGHFGLHCTEPDPKQFVGELSDPL